MSKFDTYSNLTKYGKYALPFDQIVFGTKSPVLETELNDMQIMLGNKMSAIMNALGGSCWSPNASVEDSVGIVDKVLYVGKATIFDTLNNLAFNTGDSFASVDLSSYDVGSVATICIHVTPTILDSTNATVSPYGDSSLPKSIDGKNAIVDPRLGVETSRRLSFEFEYIVKEIEEATTGSVIVNDFYKDVYIPLCKVKVTDDSLYVIGYYSTSRLTSLMVDYSVDNLIPYPYYETTLTENGITWMVDEDGVITTNGIPNSSQSLHLTNINTYLLKAGTYTLSGCPSGGAWSTYHIRIETSTINNLAYDKGEGSTFTISEDTYVKVVVSVTSKAKDNLVFKPMLTKGTTKYRWTPYKLSRQSLREDIDEVGQNTAENLFNTELRFNINRNGVVASVNENKNGVLNGTCTTGLSVLTYTKEHYINISDLEVGESITLSAKILSGSYTSVGTTPGTFFAMIRTSDGTDLDAYRLSAILNLNSDIGVLGSRTFTMTQEAKDAGAYYLYPQIWADTGDVFDNLEFQIMIERGSVCHNATDYKLSRKSIREDLEKVVSGETSVGNADKLDGLNSTDFYKLGVVEPLAEKTDLDTLLTPNQYGTDSDAIAQSILNKPSWVTSKFKLIVEYALRGTSQNYIRQTIIMGNNTGIISRVSVNGVFREWVNIADGGNALNATNATNDSDGNKIVDTYAKITDVNTKVATAESNAKSYTDDAVKKVTGLAPENADTLEEIVNLIAENEDAMELLNAAVGNKANKTEVIGAYAGHSIALEWIYETFGALKAHVDGTAQGLLLDSNNYKNFFDPANFYNNETPRTANTVLAAPNGSDGRASFRKLEVADLPDGTVNYRTVTVDLRDTSVYDANTWYPVINEHPMPKGLRRVTCYAVLNDGDIPSWSTHDLGFTSNVDVLTKDWGWGATDGKTIILEEYAQFVSDNLIPIKFFQTGKSSTAGFYVRGGGIYKLHFDYNANARIITAEESWYGDILKPQSSPPANFDYIPEIRISDIDSILSKYGGTMTGNLFMENGTYISGETGVPYPLNHAIELGASQKDYMNFYEFGGIFNFYKSQNGVHTLLGSITEDGWTGVSKLLRLTHDNEVDFIGNSGQTRQWFNYRNADTDEKSTENLITEYLFGNKNGDTTGVTLIADFFSGIAEKAKLLTNRDSNYKQGTDLPSSYPVGRTTFVTYNPTNKFNNVSYGTVDTIRGHSNSCTQFLYPHNVGGSNEAIYYRTSQVESDAWKGWKKLSTTVCKTLFEGNASTGTLTESAYNYDVLLVYYEMHGVEIFCGTVVVSDGLSDVTHYGIDGSNVLIYGGYVSVVDTTFETSASQANASSFSGISTCTMNIRKIRGIKF